MFANLVGVIHEGTLVTVESRQGDSSARREPSLVASSWHADAAEARSGRRAQVASKSPAQREPTPTFRLGLICLEQAVKQLVTCAVSSYTRRPRVPPLVRAANRSRTPRRYTRLNGRFSPAIEPAEENVPTGTRLPECLFRWDFANGASGLEPCQSRVERTERETREEAEVPTQLLAEVIAVHSGCLLQEPQDCQFEHGNDYIRSTYRFDMSDDALCRGRSGASWLTLRSANVGDARDPGSSGMLAHAAWYRDPWGVHPCAGGRQNCWTAFTSLGTWRPGVSGPGVWGPGGPGTGRGSSNVRRLYKRFDGPIWDPDHRQ